MTRRSPWVRVSVSTHALIAFIITALLLSIAVPSLAAAQGKGKGPPDRFTSRTTNVFLDAFDPESGVSVFLYRIPGGGYELCAGSPDGFGCTFVEEDAVTIAADLSSATVAPTTIPIWECDEFDCTVVDEITVALTFEGTGDLTRFQSRFKSSNGCRFMGASKGIQRSGEATITLDGQVYQAFAFLSVSTETFRVQCKN